MGYYIFKDKKKKTFLRYMAVGDRKENALSISQTNGGITTTVCMNNTSLLSEREHPPYDHML